MKKDIAIPVIIGSGNLQFCLNGKNIIAKTQVRSAILQVTIQLVYFTFFFNISVPAFSQKEIITTASGYITQSKFDQANYYLDSILNKNPSNIDALMMKGNVLLNYSWQHTSKAYFNFEKAESVFDTTAINESFFIPIIPDDTSKMIEKIWKKCLAIDSTRTDIKKGLCNLYSISLRIADLKRELHQIQKVITENPENAYIFSEYARNIKARGRFDDALKIYGVIAGMFPNMAGPRCDMAGEYFYAGRPNDALHYLYEALSKSDIDETSYVNAAGIYSILGYYNKAYKTLKKYSQKYHLLSVDFYKGLMLFAKMDTGYFDQLKSFLQKASEQNYYDEVHLAQKLLPYATASLTFDDYKALASDATIPDYYKALILQRGMLQFKNECEPFLQYGLLQCGVNNFGIAAPFLKHTQDCKTNSEQAEHWRLLYAYALYMSGDKEKALLYFKPLEEAKNLFRQQAAEYFSAKILKQKQDLTTLKKSSNLLTTKDQTKYAWLEENYLRKRH